VGGVLWFFGVPVVVWRGPGLAQEIDAEEGGANHYTIC
jgi:hypothetical protein